jgi:hypothetical protein
MKTNSVRNSAVALLGLVSLLIYVLACTSFSPDDSKVLYPAFDGKTGATGVSAYDRASGNSTLLFLPAGVDVDKPEIKPVLCRAQWLPDGKSVVVAWPQLNSSGEASDDGLNLEVLPFNRVGPVRLLTLPGVKEGIGQLARPLAVAGTYLFLPGESNSFVRVDLATGQILHQSNPGEILLLPSAGSDRLFYLAAGDTTNAPIDVGTINPDTFVRTRMYQITSKEFDASARDFIISRDGKRLAYFGGGETKPIVEVFENGQPMKSRPLTSGDQTLELGSAQFSPRGDVLYASFMSPGSGGTNTMLGILEIPVNGAAVRRVMLIPDAGKVDSKSALFFQLDVAHDGKALAVASTYLAVDNALNAVDCALFLVDLTDPQRKVTKVPVPQPPRTGSPGMR